jgi:hypothetical protein
MMDLVDSELDERRSEVAAAIREEGVLSIAMGVDVEDIYLLSGAFRCYVYGADAGAVFCAHASCERDLASTLFHAASPPIGLERWGLGRFVEYCRANGLLPSELLERLVDLNESRKALYHFGHTAAESALTRRTAALLAELGSAELYRQFAHYTGRNGDPKEVYGFAMDLTIRKTALAALRTGLALRTRIAAVRREGGW